MQTSAGQVKSRFVCFVSKNIPVFKLTVNLKYKNANDMNFSKIYANRFHWG